MHALRSTKTALLRVSLVWVAAVLTACLLAMLVKLEPSQAAFPGQNGKIAFYRSGEIYTMDADGSNQTNITNNPATDRNPAWSPDGAKVAFQRFVSGPDYEIYTMDADGSNQTRLTGGQYPAWSPDGTKIAFIRSHGSFHDYEIYTMDADGSNQTRLTTNTTADWSPAWSPDGTKIAFSSSQEDFNWDIYTMNADGTNRTRLTNTAQEPDHYAAWSPDGTKIAFSINLDEIYTMNADGSNQTNITNNFLSDDNPAWSPDGTKIAFERSGEIYITDPDGSNQTLLTNSSGSDFEPDWQPLPTNTAPTVTGLRPPPGSSTTDRTPTMAATVKDQQTDLAKSNIELILDDATIPRNAYSYNPSTDRMSYTPQKKLSLGKHAVKVTARDGSGLSTTKRWSFEVVHP